MITRENGQKALGVGVIGAGMISDIYISNMISKFENLEVYSITSKHMEHAKEKAAKYGLAAVSLEEMLADARIDMVVVLTPVGSHAELITAALNAGKHVYTEKTITDSTESAAKLLKLAAEKKLYLGSAPDTFLGSALQTARKAIEDGLLGEVTSISATANRCNDVLQTFFGFLREPGAGILFDYAVYYMTAMVSLLGPVARTAAFVRTPYPQHRNIDPKSPDFGKMMDTPNESQVSAILQFACGCTGTLQLNADSNLKDQARFFVYGTKGMLTLTDPNQFGNDVVYLANEYSEEGMRDTKPEILPPANPYSENSRGIGPSEMADAILSGRKNRANGEMAYHVLEVLEGMLQSGKDGCFVELKSGCEKPAALSD